MKIILFKLSLNEKDFLFNESLKLLRDLSYELSGVATAAEGDAGKTFENAPVFYLPQITEDMADFLALPYLEDEFDEKLEMIFKALKDLWQFPKAKIVSPTFLLKQFMSLKYADSKDEEIQNTLKYWKTHDLTPFNQYFDTEPDAFDEVFFDDKADLPYINFKTDAGKTFKMYYPKTIKFKMKDGRPYVKNVLKEQIPKSPHLYINGSHSVQDGDIIIDAGVCEGNFALRFVDVAKKIYLFENNPHWIKVLKYTFKDMKNVKLIPLGVSNVTNADLTKIDDAVKKSEKSRYFLKMDVEGYELEALRGAQKLFSSCDIKSSVCVYHKYDDDVKIKAFLESFGHKTEFTKGYISNFWLPNVWQMRDFRRCVIYGD